VAGLLQPQQEESHVACLLLHSGLKFYRYIKSTNITRTESYNRMGHIFERGKFAAVGEKRSSSNTAYQKQDHH
jgi:hypothetical protein